jgi:hypothetical protein
MNGVKVNVVPLVNTRQGLGGWMLMKATSGSANRVGGPGGITKVSMLMMPHAVAIVVRA